MSKSAEQIRSNSRSPFGLPIIAELKNEMTAYESKFNKAEKSCKVLEVTVPIDSCGAMVTATIYGRLRPNTTGHELSFAASVPKGVYFENGDQRDDFLAWAETAAQRSANWEKLTARAEAVLLGQKPERKADDKRVERPRLVRNVANVIAKPTETPAAPQPSA
jgi:hypothetical protein